MGWAGARKSLSHRHLWLVVTVAVLGALMSALLGSRLPGLLDRWIAIQPWVRSRAESVMCGEIRLPTLLKGGRADAKGSGDQSVPTSMAAELCQKDGQARLPITGSSIIQHSCQCNGCRDVRSLAHL